MNTAQVNYSERKRFTGQGNKHNSGFTIQCRVLHALILRELKSAYGNRRLGFLWAILEPLIFLSIFVAAFQLLGRGSPAGIPAPLFFIAGFSPFFMFRDVYSQIAGGTRGNQSLLMFPQVTRMDILLCKVIVNSSVSVCVFLILLIGLHWLGFTVDLESALGVMVGFSLMIALGFGTGLVLGAVSIRYEFISSLSGPLLGRPLFFTSGLFFSASMLPPAVREIFLYNPLLHCIEYIRSSMFQSFDSRYIDLTYVGIFIIVQISLGLMLLNFFDRQRKQ